MSRKLNGRKAFTVAAVTALAGTALLNVGAANAAVGSTGKLNLPVIESGAARAVTLTGTGFKNVNGTSGLSTTATNSGYVVATAACSAPAGQQLSVSPAVNSTTKASITIPSIATAGAYKLCIATTASPSGFVSAPFTVALPFNFEGLTTAAAGNAAATAIYPSTGPVVGGGLVTLSAGVGSALGTFPASSSVLFGTVASPKVAVAKDGLSLVAVIPAMTSAATSVLTISAPGFTSKTSGTTMYTFVKALKLNTNAVQGGDTISVFGSGFMAATTPVANVYLNQGGAGTSSYACAAQQIISDTEISCTLPTASAGAGNTNLAAFTAGTVWNVTATTAVPATAAAAGNVGSSTLVQVNAASPTTVSSQSSFTVSAF